MRICFVVNNPRTQRATYTTVHLAFAAYRRGHDVAFASVDAFSQGEGSDIVAEVVRPKSGRLRDTAGYAKALTAADAPREAARLVDFDVIFLRNNPSAGAVEVDAFNPALDFGRRLKALGVLVVNDPDGLSRAGSKMYLAGFPVELRPKTLITRSVERVRAFLRELDGPAIIKPLSGFGGQNVFYVARGQAANLQQIISTVRKDGYVIVQEYLSAAAKGDKRVLLLGGAPLNVGSTVAAYKRMRPKDDIRNNMHVGGSRRRTDFPGGGTASVRSAAAAPGRRRPLLRRRRPGRRQDPRDQRLRDRRRREHQRALRHRRRHGGDPRSGTKGRASLGLPRADPAARVHARVARDPASARLRPASARAGSSPAIPSRRR